MSNLIDPKQYIKLSTYAKKYGIVLRKLYRYVDDPEVESIIIDKIPFIKDQRFPKLDIDNRTSFVKPLTIEEDNVKTLTTKTNQPPDLQKDNIVKNLTKPNVKPLTIEEDNVKPLTKEMDNPSDNQEDSIVKPLTKDNVKNLTITSDEIELLKKPESECSIEDFERIRIINQKMKK